MNLKKISYFLILSAYSNLAFADEAKEPTSPYPYRTEFKDKNGMNVVISSPNPVPQTCPDKSNTWGKLVSAFEATYNVVQLASGITPVTPLSESKLKRGLEEFSKATKAIQSTNFEITFEEFDLDFKKQNKRFLLKSPSFQERIDYFNQYAPNVLKMNERKGVSSDEKTFANMAEYLAAAGIRSDEVAISALGLAEGLGGHYFGEEDWRRAQRVEAKKSLLHSSLQLSGYSPAVVKEIVRHIMSDPEKCFDFAIPDDRKASPEVLAHILEITDPVVFADALVQADKVTSYDLEPSWDDFGHYFEGGKFHGDWTKSLLNRVASLASPGMVKLVREALDKKLDEDDWSYVLIQYLTQ